MPPLFLFNRRKVCLWGVRTVAVKGLQGRNGRPGGSWEGGWRRILDRGGGGRSGEGEWEDGKKAGKSEKSGKKVKKRQKKEGKVLTEK